MTAGTIFGTAMSVGTTIAESRADVYAESEGMFNLVCVATTTGRPMQIKNSRQADPAAIKFKHHPSLAKPAHADY